jgi:hypothetical protein
MGRMLSSGLRPLCGYKFNRMLKSSFGCHCERSEAIKFAIKSDCRVANAPRNDDQI